MISKNGVALIVMVVSLLGGSVSETDVSTTVSTIGQLVSLIFMLYNQYGRKDVTGFIFKKDE